MQVLGMSDCEMNVIITRQAAAANVRNEKLKENDKTLKYLYGRNLWKQCNKIRTHTKSWLTNVLLIVFHSSRGLESK